MEAYPNPLLVAGVLALLGLAPFIAILISSFVKIVIVMHIMRSALGLQQEPPNMAVSGIAIILTIFIMAPVGTEAYDIFTGYNISDNDITNPYFREALTESLKPLQEFLTRHSSAEERYFFANKAQDLWPPSYANEVGENHLLVLVPSFLVSELTSAFQMGFLLFLPFVVIDLIISNILLSMGMIMVSPMVISLPFKILLFVLVDGWSRLIHALILTYQ